MTLPYRAGWPAPGVGNGARSPLSSDSGLYERCERCRRPFAYSSRSRLCTECLTCAWCHNPIGALDAPRGCPGCDEVFCSESHYLDHTFALGHHGW